MFTRCRGSLAQLVEQRPEEPCVPSSSLGGATIFCKYTFNVFLFLQKITPLVGVIFDIKKPHARTHGVKTMAMPL